MTCAGRGISETQDPPVTARVLLPTQDTDRSVTHWATPPDLAERSEETRITFQDTQIQPRRVITSPEWSGIDEEGRSYAAFTINVERDKPWHTLSGRMHCYLDHEWMLELGEGWGSRSPCSRRSTSRRRGTSSGGASGRVADCCGWGCRPCRSAAAPSRRSAHPGH